MKHATRHIPTHDFLPENDLGQLNLRYVPLEVRNDYDFSEPHRHGYYEIFFFRKGGGTHLVDFVQHDVTDHSVHIVRPGQVHLLHRAPASHGAVIHFSKETVTHLQPAAYHRLQDAHAAAVRHHAAAYSTIEILLHLLENEVAVPEAKQEVLAACLGLLLLKSIVPGDKPVKQDTKTLQHFSIFRRLAEEHYRSGNKPAWYAAQLHITEKRLNETCRAATGHTVSDYLKERVLLEAKRLLSHSAGSIKEIGYYLGFEDPAYFTRFFRKNAGITAGDFRNKYK